MRMACARLLGLLCFKKMPEAPNLKASADSSAVMPAVTIRILPVKPLRWAAAMNWPPWSSPRSKSTRATSAGERRSRLQSFGAGAAVAHHFEIRLGG